MTAVAEKAPVARAADDEVTRNEYANVDIVADEGTEDDHIVVKLTAESTETEGWAAVEVRMISRFNGNNFDQAFRVGGKDLDRLIRCLTSVRDRRDAALKAARSLDRTTRTPLRHRWKT
jgi:hypothetical protein